MSDGICQTLSKPFPGWQRSTVCNSSIILENIPPKLWHYIGLQDILPLQVLQSVHQAEEAAFDKYWLLLTEQTAAQWEEGLACIQWLRFISVYLHVLTEG